MYVYILSYLVNKLEIRWLYLSPIEKEKKNIVKISVLSVQICPGINFRYLDILLSFDIL